MNSFFVILLGTMLFTPVVPSQPVKKNIGNQVTIVRGVASYYSRAGCVGCSKTMTMANGQSLDDSALTLAFQKTKLNKIVTVKNLKTGQSVRAKVTDRGGYERLGRIADLSLATKNAIGCSDLCQVEISY